MSAGTACQLALHVRCRIPGICSRHGRAVRHHGAMRMRMASPADYDAIAPVIDNWWGRPILGSLPRLFVDLFYRTSLVIDGPAGPEAFLIGAFSPSDTREAYIHFVGVARKGRRRGYGRLLYEEFFRLARADGRSRVSAITAPVNRRSADFHRAMGFTVTGPVPDYNGPGHDMLVFGRAL
jgi:GNAT superfamily N-acetyltransferase